MGHLKDWALLSLPRLFQGVPGKLTGWSPDTPLPRAGDGRSGSLVPAASSHVFLSPGRKPSSPAWWLGQ